ncbi:MAG: low molecular weight phosphotyrosine protein phosphatase [Ruminococcus sp.]|nr:low molecular weight phosphotyrosine protein phosphatase [Ruminococcus sp.]
MIKIMFVCHGNICRSPMAEFIMKKLVSDMGYSDKVYIASSATSTEEIGNSVYPPAKAELAKHGIGCSGKTAIRNMNRIFGSDNDGKIYKLLTFTGRGDDVADPWYSRDFETTYRDIDAGCRGLIRELFRE